jgi:hypothetical protein
MRIELSDTCIFLLDLRCVGFITNLKLVYHSIYLICLGRRVGFHSRQGTGILIPVQQMKLEKFPIPSPLAQIFALPAGLRY